MSLPILVAIDDSACSERAARLAGSLAVKLSTRVVVMHVAKESRRHELIEDEATGEALLTRFKNMVGPGVDLKTRLTHGEDVALSIVETANVEGCAMIVMGTHGREGVQRLLLGSVAERVTRLANVPVMLSRGKATPGQEVAFGEVLVALDGSTASILALGQALELASVLHAKLALLHVIPDVSLPAMGAMGVYVDVNVQDGERRLREAGQAVLSAAADRAAASNVAAETLLYQAGQERPGDVIVRLASERGCGLIVMGTHGRSGFDRLLLGSVAERVAHRAEQPVLLVRSKDQ